MAPAAWSSYHVYGGIQTPVTGAQVFLVDFNLWSSSKGVFLDIYVALPPPLGGPISQTQKIMETIDEKCTTMMFQECALQQKGVKAFLGLTVLAILTQWTCVILSVYIVIRPKSLHLALCVPILASVSFLFIFIGILVFHFEAFGHILTQLDATLFILQSQMRAMRAVPTIHDSKPAMGPGFLVCIAGCALSGIGAMFSPFLYIAVRRGLVVGGAESEYTEVKVVRPLAIGV